MSSNNVEFYLISVLLETEKFKRTPTLTMLCVLKIVSCKELPFVEDLE